MVSSDVWRPKISSGREQAWRQREMGDFFVQPDGALPDRLPQMLVIAAGGCELKTRGKKYQLFTPKVVRDPTRRPFPFTGRLVLTIVGADEYMELST
jgi:hypothetical protein